MRERIVEVLAGVLKLAPSTFSEETTPASVPGWDSAKHVEIVVALEDRFGCMFDPDDVAELTSLAKIEEILTRHGCN